MTENVNSSDSTKLPAMERFKKIVQSEEFKKDMMKKTLQAMAEIRF